MGYEIRFIIGLKSNLKEKIKDKEYNYVEKIAVYNYCCDYTLADFTQKYSASGCYIYNNDEEVIVDPYGEELREIPIQELYDFLVSDNFSNKDYRRYEPFKMLLAGFLAKLEEFENLVVLSYGY